jgi:hypothetical protein
MPPSISELQREVARLQGALAQAQRRQAVARERETEGLAREVATAEVLRVIASSPTELESVLNAVAASAVRLCGAGDAIIYRVAKGTLRPTAGRGPAAARTLASSFEGLPMDGGSVGSVRAPSAGPP